MGLSLGWTRGGVNCPEKGEDKGQEVAGQQTITRVAGARGQWVNSFPVSLLVGKLGEGESGEGRAGRGESGRIGERIVGKIGLFCSLPAKCACVICAEETSKAEEDLQFQALEYPVAATKIYYGLMKEKLRDASCRRSL